MIVDRFEQWPLYAGLDGPFVRAFHFIESLLPGDLSPRNIEVDGDKMYSFIAEYTTKSPEKALWESHKKYIDICYIISGREIMEWAPADFLKQKGDYDPEKDIIFYDKTPGSPVGLSPGLFTINFPQDGHKPGCWFDGEDKLRKIVVKIKV